MRCSVVFGVTSRLLVINISSSSPAVNTAAYYQRCVITCGGTVSRCPPPAVLTTPGLLQRWQQAVKPEVGSESRFLPTPPAFDAPIRDYCYAVLHRKPELCGYPIMKENLMIYLIVLTESTNVTDAHTDRQTDTAWRHRPRLHSIARQKWYSKFSYSFTLTLFAFK